MNAFCLTCGSANLIYSKGQYVCRNCLSLRETKVKETASSKIIEESNYNHPPHYNRGTIECITYIEDQQFNFNIGNAIKYLHRYRDKGTPVEDLQKAIWYIQHELELQSKIKKTEGGGGCGGNYGS